MKRITAVYVNHKSYKHIRYVCMADERGYICGKCNRGRLGHHPAPRDVCAVCKAVVKRVIWDEDYVPRVARREPIKIPEPMVKDLEKLLWRLGLVLIKGRNTPDNVGKSPEYVLLEALKAREQTPKA